ncbi:hypothetical protein ACFLUJ_05070 [Chloroflexota bacterium]
MDELSDRVGEVIEASTTDIVAQCYELYQSPALGSLVKTTDLLVEPYGIVYHATTASLEPGRRPIARGKNEASEDGVYRSSPQLLKLLRSEFSVLIVGHRQNDKLFHYLPAKPAQIHGFVYLCSPDEVREFGLSYDFLNILINTRLPVPVEEMVAATLRQISQVYEDPRAYLVAAGKELAILLDGEFNKLKAILGRIRQ